MRTEDYQHETAALAQEAAAAADRFPTPVSLDARRLRTRGEDPKAVLDVTMQFERLLPALILNIALLARDWWPGDELRRSPFPVAEHAADRQRSAS